MVKEVLSSFSELFKLLGSNPIHYSYIPPQPQLVPDQALKKAHVNKELWSALLGVYNMSNRAFDSLRIKLSCDLPFDPVLQSDFPNIKAKWEYDSKYREIIVKQFDPNESFHIAFFLDDHTHQTFLEPVIIIDNQKLSFRSRLMGYVKKYPTRSLIYASLLIASFLLGMNTYSLIYKHNHASPKDIAVEKALENWISCHPTAYKKDELTDEVLSRNKTSDSYLLILNKVNNKKDLYSLDYVVICE